MWWLGTTTALASVILAVSAAFGNLAGQFWVWVSVFVALLGCVSLFAHLQKLMDSFLGVMLTVILFTIFIVATNFFTVYAN